MHPDDPNHRPTVPLQPPSAADATRTFADPSSTLPFSFGPPIVGPVDNWPAGLTRYRPLHLLGDGGMGEVYLAHDAQLDRQVAIKFARLGRRPTPDSADRILAEARAAARLHHPGICPVFDADVCDGVPYLTMGFVQGPTLAAELKRLGPCPPAYAARLIRSVAEAMRYAHEHGVIHRDLKPGNILLTAEHEPVVTDFGLAVRLDREGLAAGVVSGTPHYMAPEQAAGDAANIGERTDVFALGVILFEMLTGRVPFDGSARSVLERVRTQPVPPVRKVRKDVPAGLARIVAKATARHPVDRFDGMGSFAEAVTDYLRTAQAPKKKPVRWLFWLVAIPTGMMLGLCLLVCGIGLVLPAIARMRGTPPTTSASLDAETRKRVELLADQGREAMVQGWNDEALAKFDEALRLDPTNVTVINWRALVYSNANRQTEALAAWTESLRLDPTDTYVRRQRADLLMGLKRYEDAIADLDVMLATADTGKGGLLVDRAEARYELRQYAAAVSDLDAVLREEKVDNFFGEAANAHYLRALTRKALGDVAGAEADMGLAKRNAASLSGRREARFKAGPWDSPQPPVQPFPPGK